MNDFHLLFMVAAGIDLNSMPVVQLDNGDYDYAGFLTNTLPSPLTMTEVEKAINSLKFRYGNGIIRFEIYPVDESMTEQQIAYHQRILGKKFPLKRD